jgi:hypothetical protein
MKKKTSVAVAALVVGLFTAQQAKPDIFGADVAVLTSILAQVREQVAQARQIYSGVQQTRDQIVRAANFVKNPQSWQSYLGRAQDVLAQSGRADDAAVLAQLQTTLSVAREAQQRVSYDQISTADMTRLSELTIEQSRLQEQANHLSAVMQFATSYQQKSRQKQWGCVSCSL